MVELVCLGEALMDFFPDEIGKPLARVSAFLPMPGGAPVNVAVAAARLGVGSAFIGKLGEDAWGYHLVELLAGMSVETRGIRFTSQARTGLNFHAQPDASTAEHLFYRHPSADQLLAPGDLDGELLSQARALHIGSISLIDEPAHSATVRAIELASECGALISCDVNYRSDLLPDRGMARRLMREILSVVDVVKVNEEEADLLTGSREIESALAALLKLGPQLAVLTLGARGCAFATAEGWRRAPGYAVQSVDAVGCGDAFTAALLCGLVRDTCDWRSRLHTDLLPLFRYANAAGALTSTRRGALPALPTAEALTEFIRSSVPC